MVYKSTDVITNSFVAYIAGAIQNKVATSHFELSVVHVFGLGSTSIAIFNGVKCVDKIYKNNNGDGNNTSSTAAI